MHWWGHEPGKIAIVQTRITNEASFSELTQIGCNFSIWRGLFKDPGPSVSAPIIRCGGLAHALRRNIKVTPLNLNRQSFSYLCRWFRFFFSFFENNLSTSSKEARCAEKRGEWGLRGGVYINRVHYMVIYNSFSKTELQNTMCTSSATQNWGTYLTTTQEARTRPEKIQFQLNFKSMS